MGVDAPIRYTKAGDVNIAYRVLGDGPIDLVWVPGLISNLDLEWEHPTHVQMFERLASFCRVISFDKRGMGLSDRSVGAPTLEERIEDVHAVMDAVGTERAALLGVSEGGPMSLLFAATYPERTTALVLYGTLARSRPDENGCYGNERAFTELYDIFEEGWGTGESLRVFDSRLMAFDSVRDFWGRVERSAGSPGTMRAFLDTLVNVDVRAVAPTVRVPTLVLHATDDRCAPISNGRWLADHVPGAKFVELSGEHLAFDTDPRFTDEVEMFLTGRAPSPVADRMLSTVLFSDIVGSTEQAASIGDRRWRAALDQHDAVVAQQMAMYRGTLVKSMGDGVLATFDGPARAISCARSIREGLRPLGLDVRIGVHTGEVEMRDGDIGGLAVHIAARVQGACASGEVLVSRTVVDLVVGSGITFHDRGEHTLKGVPGTWNLYAVSN